MARSGREFNGRVFLRCGRSSEDSLKPPKKSGELCLVADFTGNRPTQVEVGRVEILDHEPFMRKHEYLRPANPLKPVTRNPGVANTTRRLTAFDRNDCRPHSPSSCA